jgi:hypothetical protein
MTSVILFLICIQAVLRLCIHLVAAAKVHISSFYPNSHTPCDNTGLGFFRMNYKRQQLNKDDIELILDVESEVSMTGDDTHKEDDMTKQPLVPLRQVVLK